MTQSKWFLQSKVVWLALANILVAYLQVLSPENQAIANAVLVIGNRIWGGTEADGGHAPATLLPKWLVDTIGSGVKFLLVGTLGLLLLATPAQASYRIGKVNCEGPLFSATFVQNYLIHNVRTLRAILQIGIGIVTDSGLLNGYLGGGNAQAGFNYVGLSGTVLKVFGEIGTSPLAIVNAVPGLFCVGLITDAPPPTPPPLLDLGSFGKIG